MWARRRALAKKYKSPFRDGLAAGRRDLFDRQDSTADVLPAGEPVVAADRAADHAAEGDEEDDDADDRVDPAREDEPVGEDAADSQSDAEGEEGRRPGGPGG